jgi:hypothetical protein
MILYHYYDIRSLLHLWNITITIRSMIYIMIFSPIIATSQESSDLRARLEVQEEKLRSLRTLQDFGSTFSPIRGYVNMAIWLSVWIKTGCESMISISISISITVELWFLWCQTQKKWRKSSNPPSFVGFKHVKTLKLHHLVGGDWNMNGLFSIYGMSSETHWQADIFQDG